MNIFVDVHSDGMLEKINSCTFTSWLKIYFMLMSLWKFCVSTRDNINPSVSANKLVIVWIVIILIRNPVIVIIFFNVFSIPLKFYRIFWKLIAIVEVVWSELNIFLKPRISWLAELDSVIKDYQTWSSCWKICWQWTDKIDFLWLWNFPDLNLLAKDVQILPLKRWNQLPSKGARALSGSVRWSANVLHFSNTCRTAIQLTTFQCSNSFESL